MGKEINRIVGRAVLGCFYSLYDVMLGILIGSEGWNGILHTTRRVVEGSH